MLSLLGSIVSAEGSSGRALLSAFAKFLLYFRHRSLFFLLQFPRPIAEYASDDLSIASARSFAPIMTSHTHVGCNPPGRKCVNQIDSGGCEGECSFSTELLMFERLMPIQGLTSKVALPFLSQEVRGPALHVDNLVLGG